MLKDTYEIDTYIDDTDDEVRIGTGTRRYRGGEIPGVRAKAQQEKRKLGNRYTPRASRTQEQRLTRRPASEIYEDDDFEDVRTTQPGSRAPRYAAPTIGVGARTTQPGRALAPVLQYQPRRIHWLLYVGVAMVLLLILWIVIVHIYVWGTNTFHDPGYYTQTAHRDVTTIPDAQGHQEQARAFIDAQNHLDLLIIPSDGNMSKAHIIQGPDLVSIPDAQHKAYIEVSAEGTSIIVVAHAPLEADIIAFAPTSHNAQWAVDLSQPSSKGGK